MQLVCLFSSVLLCVLSYNYFQSLRKISKFVNSNILPGASTEVGLLCCACVISNPEEAAVHLIKPILMSILSSFEGTPVSGFGGGRAFDASVSTKVCLYLISTYMFVVSSVLSEFCVDAGYTFTSS